MHEKRDLRRAALESKKTKSRRAQRNDESTPSSITSSRSGSAVASPTGSKPGSRNGSRYGSEDEGDSSDDESDYTTLSVESLESSLPELGVTSEPSSPVAMLSSEQLSSAVDNILDRKLSISTQRGHDVLIYNHILRMRFSQSELSGRASQIYKALFKLVKDTEQEKVARLALRSVSLTALTLSDESSWETLFTTLCSSIYDCEFVAAKAEGIYAIGVLTYAADDSDIDKTLEYLTEIMESDGSSVDAADDAGVVSAAIDAWSLIATAVDEEEEDLADAMPHLTEQLGSSDAAVLVSAGEAIALLYEKAQADEAEDKPGFAPSRRRDDLLKQLHGLAHLSGKSISKRDRRAIRVAFADILQSVENPALGPRYSTALRPDSDQEFGHRMEFRVSKQSTLTVRYWWQFVRIKALRRLLQDGFLEHWRENALVAESLPLSTDKW